MPIRDLMLRLRLYAEGAPLHAIEDKGDDTAVENRVVR